MYAIVRRVAKSVMLMGLLLPAIVLAQESRRPSLNVGFSAWPNNCDIPSGGHDTGLHPSFGPFFLLSYGKFYMSGTFFLGNFDVDPHDGLVRVDSNTVQFSDEEARARGFTPSGHTKRMDLEVSFGYTLSRYAQLSLSFVVNRHQADILTLWSAKFDDQGNLLLPSDPERQRPLTYTDTQFWIGEGFHGSAPIDLVSNRFSLSYHAVLLFIAGESGSGRAGEIALGSRVTYTKEEGANEPTFPPRDLGNRAFGSNVGIAVSTALAFELFQEPSTAFFVGYSIKFFSEKETDLIDHSIFKGPYAGISLRVF